MPVVTYIRTKAEGGQGAADGRLPLIVDLDGTLIRNDLTHDLLLLCARWHPHLLFLAVWKLLVSRADGKRWLTEKIGHLIEPEHLPYCPLTLDTIRKHREAGGHVELVSGSDDELVGRVADHLGLFHDRRGSLPPVNLVSGRKAAYVSERHGNDFLYAGNSGQDIAVWKASVGGYGLGAPGKAYRLKSRDGKTIPVNKLRDKSSQLVALLKEMRLHQWAKNLLIFLVPGLVISQLTGQHLINVIAGFFCLSVLASGTYILNDLSDIPDDRAHATKSKRPLAAGLLSIPVAIMAVPVLILSGLGGAWLLDPQFFLVCATYTALTLLYSFRLKRIAIIDVLVLASLFSLRVISGAVLAEAPPSDWLMTFVGFFFLSLALSKRYVEVARMAQAGKVRGRGYHSTDIPVLLMFGVGCSVAAIIAFITYGLLAGHRVIENHGILLCVAAIMTGWLMRLWLVAVRGELHDDPVLFAVKDRTSLLTILLMGGLVVFETSRPIWSNLF